MSHQNPRNITWHQGTVTREDRQRLLNQKGVTLWLTGLSASGKSTISTIVEQKLIAAGHLAYRLDGDNIRHGLNKNLGFSAEDRTENIRRIGEVAKLFTDAGIVTLASFISPYKQDRNAVRALHASGDFVEVYVKVSIQSAAQRDPKGLYKRALAGEIKNFTGVDVNSPYEVPENPEILIDTECTEPDQAAEQILEYLNRRGCLGA